MFRILQSAGLYSHIPYDDNAFEIEGQVSSLPLDPIEVARSANVNHILLRAQHLKLAFAEQAIGWLGSIEDLWIEAAPLKPPPYHSTNADYHRHLRYLSSAQVKVCELATEAQLRFVSGYFAIPKNDQVARSIFSGRKLSLKHHPPPPVNLPEVGEIHAKLRNMIASSRGKLWGFTADIRHWFHQLQTGPEVNKYFGIKCNGQFYRWVCLPMGWSYSPRICQCIAWTVLLDNATCKKPNADGLEVARRSLVHCKDPPKFVALRNDAEEEIGFITLTYDNILVACSDPAIERTLHSRILASFSAAGIVWKEMHRFSPKTIAVSAVEAGGKIIINEKEEDPGISHLGVQYAISHSEEEGVLFNWRHDPSRVPKWVALVLEHEALLAAKAAPTCRAISRLVGILLWGHAVAREPLCQASQLMAIIRKVAGYVAGRVDLWDTSLALARDEHQFLIAQLKNMTANPWHNCAHAPVIPCNVLLFTDASDTGLGAVLTTLNGTQQSAIPWMDRCPPSLLGSHIFLKELIAACWYIRRTIRVKRLRNTILNVVVDNSACAFALRNMYSSNVIACQKLSKLHDILAQNQIELNILQCLSEENPSDTPSRGSLRIEEERFQRGMIAAMRGMYGLKSTKRPEPYRRVGTKSVRHEPGTTDDWLTADEAISQDEIADDVFEEDGYCMDDEPPVPPPRA